MEQQQQAGMQDHMQALTELRQYVRAEQNRPVLGASKKAMGGEGPGMGGLSSLLSQIMGQGGDPAAQEMLGGVGRAMGGLPAPMTSSIASGRPPVGSAGPGPPPGSISARRRRMGGGLVPMPGMGGYGGLMGDMR